MEEFLINCLESVNRKKILPVDPFPYEGGHPPYRIRQGLPLVPSYGLQTGWHSAPGGEIQGLPSRGLQTGRKSD
jgi:hypothetical protein